MSIKILITGFEPFGSFDTNISETIVKEIEHTSNYSKFVNDLEIHTCILSVTYNRSEQELKQVIEKIKPDFVLMLGMNSSDTTFTLERVAINADNADIFDNDNELRQGCQILEHGPVGYWSDLPVERMLDELAKNNISVKDSYHAGNFICNHIFYYMNKLSETLPFECKSGFIHITPLESDMKRWGMQTKGSKIEDVQKGIRTILACIADDARKVFT